MLTAIVGDAGASRSAAKKALPVAKLGARCEGSARIGDWIFMGPKPTAKAVPVGGPFLFDLKPPGTVLPKNMDKSPIVMISTVSTGVRREDIVMIHEGDGWIYTAASGEKLYQLKAGKPIFLIQWPGDVAIVAAMQRANPALIVPDFVQLKNCFSRQWNAKNPTR